MELGAPDGYQLDGIEPQGMTAKNGAPGGSFCVVWAMGGARRKTRDSGLIAACGGLS